MDGMQMNRVSASTVNGLNSLSVPLLWARSVKSKQMESELRALRWMVNWALRFSQKSRIGLSPATEEKRNER